MPVSPSYTTALTLGSDVDQEDFLAWMEAVETLANGNETNVAALLSDVSSLQTTAAANVAAITALQAADVVHAADIATLQSTVAGLSPLPAQVSGAEITAGTETALRSYSPEDIVALIDAHAAGGGGGGFLPYSQRVRAFQTSGQGIPSGSPTVISFNNESYDSDGVWDPGDPGKFVIPAAWDGKFVTVFGQAQFSSSAVGTSCYLLVTHKNANDTNANVGMTFYAGAGYGTAISGPIQVATGQYFQFACFQNSGSNRTLLADGRVHFGLAVVAE